MGSAVGEGPVAVGTTQVQAPVTTGAVQSSAPLTLGPHPAGDPVQTNWDVSVSAGSGSDLVNVYHQPLPGAVWEIAHGLGRRLTAWSLFDEDGTLCGEYRVENVSQDLARVVMDTPTAGTFRYI